MAAMKDLQAAEVAQTGYARAWLIAPMIAATLAERSPLLRYTQRLPGHNLLGSAVRTHFEVTVPDTLDKLARRGKIEKTIDSRLHYARGEHPDLLSDEISAALEKTQGHDTFYSPRY